MKLITQILHQHKAALGSEYEAYHNHAQRVYYYAITLLLTRESQKLAICAAFHDLDIWTGQTMNYLTGSQQLATTYLSKTNFDLLADEISFIIQKHHQLRSIKGNIEAEAFRKADLIDLTTGKIRFNMPLSIVQATETKYPRRGFSRLILKKTFNHALAHPLNPLPMLKW